VVPSGVVTFTVLRPVVAVGAIVNVAVTLVELTTVRPLTVIPVPETLIAVAPVRFAPVRVTGTAVPRMPAFGLIEVRLGPAVMVKNTLLLTPLGVVTVTFLAPVAAVDEIVKLAVKVVSFTTVRPLTVTPVAGVTVIADVVNRLVPVSVTATVVFREPRFGVIEVRVGAPVMLMVTVAVLLLTLPSLARKVNESLPL